MTRFLTTLLLLTVPFAAHAQERIAKKFSGDEQAFIDSPVAVGWLCFDRAVFSERDGHRCYLPPKPGTFQVAALSKENVGEVQAYYIVTIGGGSPTPNPGPITPPAPDDVPNAMGLGLLAYQHAVAANDPVTAKALAGMYLALAAGIEKIYAERGDVSEATLKNIGPEIGKRFTQITKSSAPWQTWSGAVHGKLNQLNTQAGGWHGDDWIAVCKEIAGGLQRAAP